MGLPGGMEWIVILGVIVLLFGAKKIPDLAKGIGSGIREFKKAAKEDESKKELDDASKQKPEK
ncbi:MAG: twin-arginine translocase TatA/TatE family subunit [Candidatus Thermoplasmatota archaeon]|nr:twin-arginine translocase TatA/TatE family subunit [Candidatus Thermoplasmatota archaeon]